MTVQALEDVATRLRIASIRSTTKAGSGHPSSAASAAEMVAATMFHAMRVEPGRPRSPASDRFVLSKGHAAPVLYAAWAEAGVLPVEELARLRTLESDLEGHPTPRLPFVDVATGSLGQGLGVGAGLALGARMLGFDSRAFVLLGDGECAEGAVWEAAQLAAHLGLDTLVALVDVNGLGQSGPTMAGHDTGAYRRRFEAFGWRALEVDGHDVRAVMDALDRAVERAGAPTAIVARTVKGKGIEGVEGLEHWHGRPLPPDMAERACAALEARLHGAPRPRLQAASVAASGAPVGTRAAGEARRERPLAVDTSRPTATRAAYGDALVRLGAEEPRLVVLDGDVKNSTYAERFRDAYPPRFVDAYIAEQNMVSMAAGLAAQGLLPFASSFACFLTRAADQIRMVGISKSNVKLAGSHAGVSIGEDGPSQMGLEDLALFRALPGALVLYPADAVSTDACVRLAAAHDGPAYIRTTRPATPAIYPPGERFEVGGLSILRSSMGDAAAIVAAGITVHEALAAHDALAAEGIHVAVVDLYCVKPIGAEALRRAVAAAGDVAITVEDHYAEGGLGEAVLAALAGTGALVHVLAVREVPRSGPGPALLERYGIGRAAIAARVRAIAGPRAAAA